MNAKMLPKKLDIIWNVTRICGYYCSICCVDAIQVIKKNEQLILISGLNKEKKEYIPAKGKETSIYTQAGEELSRQGKELSFQGRLQILDNLKGMDVKIDFSGGDPLLLPETAILIKRASEYFGRANITLTSTGGGLLKAKSQDVLSFVGELNFTYDAPRAKYLDYRERGYTDRSLRVIREIAKSGVKTRAEMPLSEKNISEESLRMIYEELHEENIDKLLVMRLFPSGRCNESQAVPLTKEQYLKAIAFLKKLEEKYQKPKIRLQCALKHVWTQDLDENPCDLVSHSYGLTPSGQLLASPWAIGIDGEAVDDAFLLGDLSKQSIKEILEGEKVQSFLRRKDENFGHCKMHAYFANPGQKNSWFKMDPLYGPLASIRS